MPALNNPAFSPHEIHIFCDYIRLVTSLPSMADW
jgi:hypothetical protein